MLLKEEYRKLINSLLPYAQKQLGFEEAPKITFRDDRDNSTNPLGKTGYYEPKTKEITVFVTNRHPKDILRSVSHELVHYQQDCDGRLTKHMRSDLHNKNYAQTNPKLREFEEEAYLYGNMIFRDWEDNYKNAARNTNTIRIKQMNESNLRAYIRNVIAEIVAETKKKEEEQKVDVSTVRDSSKKFLKNKKLMAEEEEESMPLNEWKNDELFGLLNKRFGILTESSSKPDFLDLDKDGDTEEPMKQAAKQAKAKNATSQEEEEEEEEEELDEAKMTKSQIVKGHKIAKGILKGQKGKKGKKLSKDSAYAIGASKAKSSK